MPRPPDPKTLGELKAVVGSGGWLDSGEELEPYLSDLRRLYRGATPLVLLPRSVAHVVQILRICARESVAVVPHGGNTSYCGGATPDESGSQIVLCLRRLNRIRRIDAANYSMILEAGCTLSEAQAAAREVDRLFPLSLGSEGTAQIGGNLSTNAGGTAVLRYGTMRELCLGLEVVTPQGELWSGLRGLRKDNTGYDLRDLYIGAEGTLGVITGAVLKLHPRPKASITALVALPSPAHALRLLSLMQDRCGASLTAFEWISGYCLRLVAERFPALPKPFATPPPAPHAHCVLLEVASSESAEHAVALLENGIGTALDSGLAGDAVVAHSLAQSRALWQLREHIPLAQAAAGKNIKHDVALPVSRIADFIAATDALLAAAFPGCQLVCFGHVGDGNLHYNVAPPPGMDERDFLAGQEAVNRVVHDSVDRFGGSISAEHGIGALKRDELARYKAPLELQLMRAIKTALDPLSIMNPGKIL